MSFKNKEEYLGIKDRIDSMDSAIYKKMIESTNHGVFLCQRDKIIFHNKAFANMLGYHDSGALQNKTFTSIIHADDQDKGKAFLGRRNNQEHSKQIEEFKLNFNINNDNPVKNLAEKKTDEELDTVRLKIESSVIELDGDQLILGNAFTLAEQNHYQEKLNQTYKDIIDLIARTIEINDIYHKKHHKHLQKLNLAIATEMDLSQEQKLSLQYASKVHGVGKLTVPAEILLSSGELSPVESSFLKEHPKKGYELLQTVDFPWPLAEIIYQHHERIDGSGYPNGLEGNDISLEARIFAVADVIIAMASHRPYRDAYHIGEVLQEITNKKGVLFDSEVVNACVKVFREGFQLFEE